MPSKPTKKATTKKTARRGSALGGITERDLELTEGAARNVKGGATLCGKGKPKNPKLVAIPKG